MNDKTFSTASYLSANKPFPLCACNLSGSRRQARNPLPVKVASIFSGGGSAQHSYIS